MSEHLWRVEIELKRNMVDMWNGCFDDLHILKPDYTTIEKSYRTPHNYGVVV